jgi:hypothetical protein
MRRRISRPSLHVADYYWHMWKITKFYKWYHLHIEEYAMSLNDSWEE